MRRFTINSDSVRDGRAVLTGDQAHHARSVLRLPPGEEVLLVDGDGREFSARIARSTSRGLELDILTEETVRTESPLDLTLGLALIKLDRMDLLVHKATELGLRTLVPVLAVRSNVRPEKDKADKRVERWRRISAEAIKQCRRGRPVDIRPVTGLRDFLAGGRESDIRLMLWEGAEPGSREAWRAELGRFSGVEGVRVLVGPEGGFTPEEASLARSAGFAMLGFGPRILRSETAALALLAVLGHELGDLF